MSPPRPLAHDRSLHHTHSVEAKVRQTADRTRVIILTSTVCSVQALGFREKACHGDDHTCGESCAEGRLLPCLARSSVFSNVGLSVIGPHRCRTIYTLLLSEVASQRNMFVQMCRDLANTGATHRKSQEGAGCVDDNAPDNLAEILSRTAQTPGIMASSRS